MNLRMMINSMLARIGGVYRVIKKILTERPMKAEGQNNFKK